MHEFVNRVICGDCIAVMREMPASSVNFVLTDPPYLVGYRSRDGRQIANDSPAAATWLAPAYAELYRVLVPDSYCVSFLGFTQADHFMAAWRAAGFDILEQLVWHKRYPSSTGFVRRYHETAYLLAKGRPPRPRLRIPSVLTEWSYTGNALHPTQKPTGALIPLLLAFSRPGDVVLDPFAGSGSTAVATTAMGRRYIAIELDTQYAQIATDRLANGRSGDKSNALS